jgi:hypothetical protein
MCFCTCCARDVICNDIPLSTDLVKQAALAQMQRMSQPAPTQELAQPSGPMQVYAYPGKVREPEFSYMLMHRKKVLL